MAEQKGDPEDSPSRLPSSGQIIAATNLLSPTIRVTGLQHHKLMALPNTEDILELRRCGQALIHVLQRRSETRGLAQSNEERPLSMTGNRMPCRASIRQDMRRP